jgi:hypothetical protein
MAIILDGSTGISSIGTLTGVTDINSPTGVLATQNGMTGIAKAWVNFNGVSTITIRDSFNVSSVTRNGTGDYSISFTTAMANINYAVSVGVTTTTAPNGCIPQLFSDGTLWGQQAPTTGGFRMVTPGTNSTNYDNARVSLSVFSS